MLARIPKEFENKNKAKERKPTPKKLSQIYSWKVL